MASNDGFDELEVEVEVVAKAGKTTGGGGEADTTSTASSVSIGGPANVARKDKSKKKNESLSCTCPSCTDTRYKTWKFCQAHVNSHRALVAQCRPKKKKGSGGAEEDEDRKKSEMELTLDEAEKSEESLAELVERFEKECPSAGAGLKRPEFNIVEAYKQTSRSKIFEENVEVEPFDQDEFIQWYARKKGPIKGGRTKAMDKWNWYKARVAANHVRSAGILKFRPLCKTFVVAELSNCFGPIRFDSWLDCGPRCNRCIAIPCPGSCQGW
jgi:hypothetical protein